MVEGVLAFDAAKENTDSAILFGEADLIDGFVHRLKR